MTRQEMLQTISHLLQQQPQEKLEAVLGWLEQSDDDFERRLRTDVEAGQFDQLIADVIAEDEAGETINLEASCDKDLLEAV
ncbi:hypothetical protein HRE53_29325 (plasmid) [Acaryochloris sp. 'Moss Beach']|uniref:hypothetical protein n=1 Tax=Acaryochloris TaxID=155977 RepID=UPI001BB05B55|nr:MULTISPECIES: hypothetical protein [Acaryochloris]QUY45813.1 hypothetical protein I1H34_29145 [Acaryochloris marina S15]UJB72862.1 hypothetical protein HRE53_29325 [Acaryochloris sp. 'Moss Beach']